MSTTFSLKSNDLKYLYCDTRESRPSKSIPKRQHGGRKGRKKRKMEEKMEGNRLIGKREGKERRKGSERRRNNKGREEYNTLN